MNNTIDIAIGLSVRSKTWKNQKIKWEDLRDKLLKEHKTSETYKQFITASKQDQLTIKDVGGYVGGYLRQGRRKPENVVHRQLLTLDIDNAHNNFWDLFTLQFDQEAVLHSTHKHTATDPRYRLVMPLSRECTPDEYAALSRQVAGMLGIELFDNTTFQSERLMFWPSNSKDMPYYAETQTGPWLDVDEILNTYVDWTDSSAWPTAEAVVREIHDKSKKQQDPTEKNGLIGAFCRAYSISEAIEAFLQDEYTRLDDSRYTYKKGSAAGGLVLYEDEFAYSHHGTDPIGGNLCNAFDLVRIHEFGHLDTSLADGNKYKSMAAMEELCRNDKKVRQILASEKISESKYDFKEALEEPTEWVQDLEIDKKGKYVSSANNISLIFANDPGLKNAFAENEFDNKKYALRRLPWREFEGPETIKNVDLSGIRNYIESVYGIVSVGKIDDALNLQFEKKRFHPVRDYLNALKWDGEPRIEKLLIDYFGAIDNDYTRQVMRKTMIAAVSRVFKPGIKFDNVLTLVGQRQGTGKSTFIAKLGGQFFSDSFHTVNGKEAFEQLQGAWIIEIAELSGLRKSEVEPIKHFISKQVDTFRPAFGRVIEDFPRQCIFIATTNERDFLRDSTGNRRFWPVDVREDKIEKSVFDTEFEQVVNDCWAEAVHYFKQGENLYLDSKAESLAKIAQTSHSHQDDRHGLIEQYLNTLLPDKWDKKGLAERRTFLEMDPLNPKGQNVRDSVCVAEIWCECLGKEKKDMSRYASREISEIMRSFTDWELAPNNKTFSIYGRQRYYQRK
jgi:predicted P-loop ATPase